MDSIALGQPALALAAKIQARAGRAGLDPTVAGDGLAERLWRLVTEAVAADLDPEVALRGLAVERLAAFRDG
jgi:XTP/dITP diphosphohydrolase